MTVITEAMLRGSHGTMTVHMNFGGAGHGYTYQSVEYPRLSWSIRTYKGRAAVKAGVNRERHLFVDGKEVADLAAAAAALNEESSNDG